MKKITLLLVSFWLMTELGIAQIPQAFKYQAVARTSTGNLIQNQLVAFRISILQGGPSGTLLYQERHTTNTNNYGLANLDIGNGTVLSGIFSSINWSAGSMFIKVEFDPLGGNSYIDMGTSQLLSVPYSLYSETSGGGGLTLPYSGTISNIDYAFSITNTLSSGICSKTTASSGNGIALYGETASSIGLGVNALATSTTGQCYGVRGQSNSSSGLGVLGHAASTTGINYGVKGQSMSSTGHGVHGVAFSSTGINYGVYGISLSADGYGIYGTAPVTGIKGVATNGSGESYGVYGQSTSAQGYGVYGKVTASVGVNYGVYGEAPSELGYGVNGTGGRSGVIGNGSTEGATGVTGINSFETGNGIGVWGYSASVSGIGIRGIAASLSGINYGVYGEVNSSSGYSGYFTGGRFYVSGKVGIGTTAADYPLVVKSTGSSTIMARFESYNSTDPVIMLRQNSNGSGGIYLYDGSNTNTIFLYGEGSSFVLGNLGIGTNSPGYKLQVGVAGDGTQARANAWNLLSDARLKKDFTALTDPLGVVDKINGYYFYWNTGIDKTRQVGFSAQEVLKAIPEVVSKGEDGYLSIDYGKMTPLLLEAIKELKSENDRLKAEIEKINARLDKFDASMSLSATK